jgi:hypothetical protein
MKDADQANRSAKGCMRRRTVGPLDKFANLLFAFFILDLHLKSNFLESLAGMPDNAVD